MYQHILILSFYPGNRQNNTTDRIQSVCMFDAATLGAALTSLKAITDLLKNANDGQLAMRIGSELSALQSQLLEVQQQALALQAEHQRLRAENEKFKLRAGISTVYFRSAPIAQDSKEQRAGGSVLARFYKTC